MNFHLKITKIDVLTIILLCVVFFGIAAWNVGEIKAPVNNWQTTKTASFYVDLGEVQPVQTVYFWVKSGNGTANISSGSPGDWSPQGTISLRGRDTDYSVQAASSATTFPIYTRYFLFNMTAVTYDSRPMFSNWGITNPTDKEPSPFVKISEIGVAGTDEQQFPIISLTAVNTTDPTLNNLVDEQDSLQIPPTYMSKMYFDEVYFARAAENYVNHQIPAERTHPPLGKLIIASGILLIGETPFGWRIMGVIFGTFIVALMYILGKKLFGTWIGGFAPAFLMTFDFMHFTMARIGTTDTYVVFFALLSQISFLIYFMNVIKKGWKESSVLPLFLAVVFFALGFSTKWFVMYSAAGLLALLVAVRLRELWKHKGGLGEKYVAFFDHPALLLIGFLGIAVAIYFAAYIPDMLAGDSFPTIVNLQFAMFSFHSGSVTDASSSPWWSWPLMFGIQGSVPKWIDITYLPNNVVSTITVFGNPILWWVGFALMIVLAERAIHGRELAGHLYSRLSKSSVKKQLSIKGWDLPAVFIVVVFAFSWLPYVLIGRATYIYHYYLSVPLLCLAAAYFINKYWNTWQRKAVIVVFFAAVVGVFILFYPVISGAPVASSYIDDYLRWIPSWYFAP